MPGATLTRLRLWSRTAATISAAASTRRGPIFCQTLLPAGAVGPGVASRAVVAEGVAAGASIRLLSVTACRVPLGLIEIAGTVLILIKTTAVLLIRSRPVLLIEVRLIGAAWLLTVVLGLSPPVVLKLGLIVFLVEFRGTKVGVSGVAIEIVSAVVVVVDVVAIDVGGIDVVPIDGGVDVAVVIVIAIDESV